MGGSCHNGVQIRLGRYFAAINVVLPIAAFLSLQAAQLQPTPPARGPYRVDGNRICDRDGRPFLMRGTELAPVTLAPIQSGDLGPLSASALVTIRQRLNMNTVRLRFDATQYGASPAYRASVAAIVRTANRFELLVILSPSLPAHWEQVVADFQSRPDVLFDIADDRAAVERIRAAGVLQPIIAAAGAPLQDGAVIYEVPATYRSTRTATDRSELFGALESRVPVLATGLDPHLDEDSAECSAFPADPAEAARAVTANLDYFDERGISWIISSFRPGRLISDSRYFNGTKLDDGWTCGAGWGMSGIGMLLLAHLWNAHPHGLFAVNGDAGSYLLARGGRVTAYGPIFAERALEGGPGPVLPTSLGNVSVRITDSRGAQHAAPLLYTGAGWSYLSFIVPDAVAAGPAEVAIVRSDRSVSVAHALIADIAPGLASASLDGRGAAKCEAIQRLADGTTRTSPTYQCAGPDCRAVPIPLSRGVATTLRILGTGFRHARSTADFEVTVGEVSVPVLSFGAVTGMPGRDQITVRLPDSLIGAGETDLYLRAGGVLSNVVRLNLGGAR
jgi:uncharacterized protein (TIGR03437 family)